MNFFNKKFNFLKLSTNLNKDDSWDELEEALLEHLSRKYDFKEEHNTFLVLLFNSSRRVRKLQRS